jgi:hypothetical protein
VQVPASTGWAHPESDIDGRGVYGFNWWANGIKPDGNRKWPELPPTTFAAYGHNNNRMFVIPDWRMVIVRLGLDESDGKVPDAVWSKFVSLVGVSRTDQAVEPQADCNFCFRIHEIGRPTGVGFGQTSATDIDPDGDVEMPGTQN